MSSYIVKDYDCQYRRVKSLGKRLMEEGDFTRVTKCEKKPNRRIRRTAYGTWEIKSREIKHLMGDLKIVLADYQRKVKFVKHNKCEYTMETHTIKLSYKDGLYTLVEQGSYKTIY